MRQRGWAHVAPVLVICLFLASVAEAQGPPTGPVASLPKSELGIKYRLSVMVSGGLDLDLFGEVVVPGVSCNTELTEGPTACRNQSRIVQASQVAHYPDVYVSVPKRFHASAGFGIFQKDELIVQVSRNRSLAEEDISLGQVITGAGSQSLRATFTTYEDSSIEGGWRHYFRAVGRSKSYVNLTYGRRKVEAITADLTTGGANGSLGTVRFYDAATLQTAAIVFGVTYERWHMGVFLEAGARWTPRLVRQDDDLRPLGVEMINNTGPRIFMPANVGIMVRF